MPHFDWCFPAFLDCDVVRKSIRAYSSDVMSARDIIREIEALGPDERRIVRDYLLQSEHEEPHIRRVDEAIANEAADRVFRDHAELFRKLAQ